MVRVGGKGGGSDGGVGGKGGFHGGDRMMKVVFNGVVKG